MKACDFHDRFTHLTLLFLAVFGGIALEKLKWETTKTSRLLRGKLRGNVSGANIVDVLLKFFSVVCSALVPTICSYSAPNVNVAIHTVDGSEIRRSPPGM